jgi:hypothetical protein
LGGERWRGTKSIPLQKLPLPTLYWMRDEEFLRLLLLLLLSVLFLHHSFTKDRQVFQPYSILLPLESRFGISVSHCMNFSPSAVEILRVSTG